MRHIRATLTLPSAPPRSLHGANLVSGLLSRASSSQLSFPRQDLTLTRLHANPAETPRRRRSRVLARPRLVSACHEARLRGVAQASRGPRHGAQGSPRSRVRVGRAEQALRAIEARTGFCRRGGSKGARNRLRGRGACAKLASRPLVRRRGRSGRRRPAGAPTPRCSSFHDRHADQQLCVVHYGTIVGASPAQFGAATAVPATRQHTHHRCAAQVARGLAHGSRLPQAELGLPRQCAAHARVEALS